MAHRLGEGLLPALAVLVALVAPLLVWGRLPDPMASHWTVGGQPDAAMGRILDLVLLAAATAIVAFGPAVAARFPMPRAQARLLVAAAGFGSVLLATVRVASVRANLDASSWEQAGNLSAGTMLVAFAAALIAGAIGWAAAGSRPDLAPPTGADPVPVEVARGGAVVWTGGASSRTALAVALGLVAIAALGAVLAPPELRTALVIVLPLLALAVSAFGQVRVTIGPRGLRVTCGWLGFPRFGVPIEDVASVTVEEVSPMSYGGWGLRQVPGAVAVVVRRGAGLRVERRNGRVFVVTVDDAAVAAGVLLAHRDATASPTS